MPFWAIIGAWLAAHAAQIAIFVASVAYQRNRQKKMEKELDKHKGHQLVIDGEPIYLPLVYGTQKVGGVRARSETFHRVWSTSAATEPTFQRWTWHPSGPTVHWLNDAWQGYDGYKPYLMTQQAFCFGDIEEIVDIEVQSQTWNKGDFIHDIRTTTNGGVASQTAVLSEMSGAATSKFPNMAWANATFWLWRDKMNYQGTPDLIAFVKGTKVFTVTENLGVYSLSPTRTYDNNNAKVLLDYLLRPKTLGGVGLGGLTAAQWMAGNTPDTSQVDLEAFYNAQQICGTVVKTITNVRGRINGVPSIDRRSTTADMGNGTKTNEALLNTDDNKVYVWDGSVWNAINTSRDVKLYECNIAIDTERSFRDNIEILLETMGNAELVYSEGKYKLILLYPENQSEQDALITGNYDDSYIVNGEIKENFDSADSRYNRVILRFDNEEQDYTTDSVSWPTYGDANHQAMLAEDSGVPMEFNTTMPGCTTRELALAKAETLCRQSRLYVGDSVATPGSGYSLNGSNLEIVFDRRFMVHDVGDLIKLSSNNLGFSNRVYKIESIEYDGRMNVKTTLQRFDYTSLSYADHGTFIHNPRESLNTDIPKPTGLSFSAVPREPGIRSRGTLTWTAPADYTGDARRYRLMYSTDAGTTYSYLGETQYEYFDLPTTLAPNSYYFSVQLENMRGRVSDQLILSGISISNMVAPTIVSATATGIANQYRIEWSSNTPEQVHHSEVYVNSTNNYGSSTKVSTVGEGQFESIIDIVQTGNNYVWVTSYDYLGVSITSAAFNISGTRVSLNAGSPTGLSLSTGVSPDTTDGSIAYVTADWDTMLNAVSYEVNVTYDSDGSITPHTTTNSNLTFFAPASTGLSVKVRSIDALGNASAWSSPQTTTTAADNIAPAVPTGLTATGGLNTITLRWNANNTESDFSHYEVYYSTSATAPTVGTTPSFITVARNQTISGLINNTLYRGYVRASDKSGNKSAWTAAASATTDDGVLTSSDIAGLVDYAAFDNDVKPVETVSSLPGAPHTEGRIVYLTTDNKLYRNTGSGWTKAINADDLADKILETHIGDNEISTPKLKARSITTAKLTVADGENLVWNPNFDGDAQEWFLENNAEYTTSQKKFGAGSVRFIHSGGGSAAIRNNHYVECQPGDSFYASGWIYVDGSYTNASATGVGIRVNWYKSDKSSNGVTVIDNDVAPWLSQWTQYEGETGPAPTDTAYVRFEFISYTQTGGTSYFDGGYMRRMDAGKLVVEGTLAASKLVTKSIKAAQIGAGEVSMEKLSVFDYSKVVGFAFDNDYDMDGWERFSGTGELAIITDPASNYGGKALQIGNNSGNDQAWIAHERLIPFDPDATYKITVRAKRTAGTGILYLGWIGVAGDGVTLVSVSGANSYTGQHYHAAAGVSPGTSYTEYTGYTRDHGSTTGTGAVGTQTSPGKMHPDVRYIRPMILANYNSATGTTYIDRFDVEKVVGSTLIEDGSIQTRHLTTESVTTDILDAEAVTTEKLSVASVTADKMTITGQDNMFRMGYFEDQEDSLFILNGGATTGFTTGVTGGSALTITKLTLTNSAYVTSGETQYTPVRAGEVYYGETEARSHALTSTGGFYYRIMWYDSSKTYLSYSDIVTNTSLTTSWQQYSKQVTAPANAAYAGWRIYNHSTNTVVNTFYVDRVILKRADASDLTVNGTIRAEKLILATAVLEDDGSGNLTISSGGVNTARIATAAVTDWGAVGLGSDQALTTAQDKTWVTVATAPSATYVGGYQAFCFGKLCVEINFPTGGGRIEWLYRILRNGAAVHQSPRFSAHSSGGTYVNVPMGYAVPVDYLGTTVSGTHSWALQVYCDTTAVGYPTNGLTNGYVTFKAKTGSVFGVTEVKR